MNIRSLARQMLNFLTFLLIIIQFVICISFSGFSCVWKVTPTSQFHRKTAGTIQWHAISSKNNLNQTTNNISTTHQRRIPQQGTIQHHTEPCIQQHIQQHTEQRIIPNDVPNNIPYIILHDIPNTKQQSTSGPIRDDLEQKTYKATGQTDS